MAYPPIPQQNNLVDLLMQEQNTVPAVNMQPMAAPAMPRPKFNRDMLTQMLLGASEAVGGTGTMGQAISRGLGGAAKSGFTYGQQQQQSDLYKQLLQGSGLNLNMPGNQLLTPDVMKNVIDLQSAKSNQEYKNAYIDYLQNKQPEGSEMFGGSKNPFLSALELANTPEKYNALSPELQVTLGLWLQNQAKNPEALYGQSYATASGKGMGTIPTAAIIESEKEKGKIKGQLGAPGTISDVEEAKKFAGEKVKDVDEYTSMTSKMPELLSTINKLKQLSGKATYTKIGQLSDEAKRQLGMPVGEGAVARTEYEAIINNQILPLLRDTFGAQFTLQEGESLKRTLGDLNKSPEEKNAVLDAFINQKINNIKSQQSKIQQKYNAPARPAVQPKKRMSADELWDSL